MDRDRNTKYGPVRFEEFKENCNLSYYTAHIINVCTI